LWSSDAVTLRGIRALKGRAGARPRCLVEGVIASMIPLEIFRSQKHLISPLIRKSSKCSFRRARCTLQKEKRGEYETKEIDLSRGYSSGCVRKIKAGG